MGIRQALDEAKTTASLLKKIGIIKKNIDKMSNDFYVLQRDMIKSGMEPEDISIAVGYAFDDLKNLIDKAQETVDLFKE